MLSDESAGNTKSRKETEINNKNNNLNLIPRINTNGIVANGKNVNFVAIPSPEIIPNNITYPKYFLLLMFGSLTKSINAEIKIHTTKTKKFSGTT